MPRTTLLALSLALLPLGCDAAPFVDPVASRHAPSGLYRIEIERVSDTCNPPRRTGSAAPTDGSPWALPGGQHGAHGWMLNLPLVTLQPPGQTRMDLLIAPGAANTSTRSLGVACPGLSAKDTFEFAGYADDGFRIRHVEESPDSSACSVKPAEAPAAACRSERVMVFHVIEACDPDCSVRLVAGKASCQCPEGRTAAPSSRPSSSAPP